MTCISNFPSFKVGEPVFVVIKITPFLPSSPYNVDAARPLRTLVEAILFGSISKERSPAIGIPSTTYNG